MKEIRQRQIRISKRMKKELGTVPMWNFYGGWYGFYYDGKRGKITVGECGYKRELERFPYLLNYEKCELYKQKITEWEVKDEG